MSRGVSSFNHVDEDLSNSTPSTPKSSKKSKQSSSSNSKNPYASRGLEKFTSVLSDLEARKEKIMAKTGLKGDGTMVRFMYSNSKDWIPIVVRLREENNNSKSNSNSNPASPKKPAPAQPKPKEPFSNPSSPKPKPKQEAQQEKAVKKRVTWIEGEGGNKRKAEWWKLRPSYHMFGVMLLMLVCLVMFGRVFAICCTAVWWYLVPNFSGNIDESGIARKRSIGKDYVRKLSDRRLSAAAGGGGVQELASPRANVSLGKRG